MALGINKAMDTKGTTIKLWTNLVNGLDKRTAALGLKRDAYLARIVHDELPHLDEEITEPLSKNDATLIRHHLKRLDTTLVTLRLPTKTAAQLDKLCRQRNLVRDAFFNRLVLALCISPKAFLEFVGFDGVNLPRALRDAGWPVEAEELTHGALDAAHATLSNPFWVIRAYLEAASKEDRVSPPYTFYGMYLSFPGIEGFEGLNLVAAPKSDHPAIDITELFGPRESWPVKARTTEGDKK